MSKLQSRTKLWMFAALVAMAAAVSGWLCLRVSTRTEYRFKAPFNNGKHLSFTVLDGWRHSPDAMHYMSVSESFIFLPPHNRGFLEWLMRRSSITPPIGGMLDPDNNCITAYRIPLKELTSIKLDATGHAVRANLPVYARVIETKNYEMDGMPATWEVVKYNRPGAAVSYTFTEFVHEPGGSDLTCFVTQSGEQTYSGRYSEMQAIRNSLHIVEH